MICFQNMRNLYLIYMIMGFLIIEYVNGFQIIKKILIRKK